MILLLDNYDSFTYNLVHLVESLGHKVLVYQNDQITPTAVIELKPQAILLGAGPKTPKDAGITLDLIQQALGQIPLFGVCLGHQALGVAAGANVMQAKQLIHGRAVVIKHQNKGLFHGLPNPIMGARYNSLVLEQCPPGYQVTAWDEDGQIMAMEHETHKACGVQFHPESFMTKFGEQLLRNFFHGAFQLSA